LGREALARRHDRSEAMPWWESLIHTVRYHTAPELARRLRRAAMTPPGFCGEFDESDFDLDSKRLIVLARKA
jgi:hypothetical protein